MTVSQEAQMLLEGEVGEGGDDRGALSAQNAYKNALFAKKQTKVAKYALTQGGKKYKKYLISKKFREDAQNEGKRLSQEEKDALT